MTIEKKLFSTLAIGAALAVLLAVIRICVTGSLTYIFLVWNLFLAAIPLLISTQMKKREYWQNNKLTFVMLFSIWLLFFPNAPYILTDLFHLRERMGMPMWFDLTLILSFAWVGLMSGFISLMQMRNMLQKLIGNYATIVATIFILFLCAFGIYLGRYERYNSWDIITNPIALFRDIIVYIVHPIRHLKVYGVTLVFSSFLILSYMTIELLSQYNFSKNNK